VNKKCRRKIGFITANQWNNYYCIPSR